MKRNTTLRWITTAALMLGLALWASSASALMVLTIDDPLTVGYDVIVVDNNTGVPARGPATNLDLDPAEGQLLYTHVGGLGSFSVVLDFAMSQPAVGSNVRHQLDTLSGSVTGGTGTLHVDVTVTDHVFEDHGKLFTLMSRIQGSTGGTVTAQSYVDFSNAEYGTAITPGTHGPMGDLGFLPFPYADFAQTDVVAPTFNDTFSMSQFITVTHDDSGDTTTFTFNTLALVPEPASMAVWMLLGGLCLALGRRRRKAA